ERRENSQRLHEQAAEAKIREESAIEASHLKSIFLANMTHEIRTPLNGIKGNTEFLLKTNLNESQEIYAKTIYESTGFLMSIVNDLLDFSKIESGQISIEVLPTNVTKILNSYPLIFSQSLKKNRNQLTIECTDISANLLCMTDPLRLRQILNNLISNAIKFTQDGTNVLYLSSGDNHSGDSQHVTKYIMFTVCDTGIGMTKEQTTRIFTPFSQADLTISRKYGGTGLGLTICHKLVSILQGHIGLFSEYGKGTLVWFSLPF
ncbi:histidine kinase-like ATPase, partial [Blyttiomyces helicus]